MEVLSASTRKRDEVLKRNLYEHFGVREYWVVDPKLEAVKAYRQLDEGGFAEATVFARERDERVETPLLPELSLSIAALFEQR